MKNESPEDARYEIERMSKGTERVVGLEEFDNVGSRARVFLFMFDLSILLKFMW